MLFLECFKYCLSHNSIMSKSWLNKIKEFSKRFHAENNIHTWEHTENVLKLTKLLLKKEKGDKDSLIIAAYLHDIGYEQNIKKNRPIRLYDSLKRIHKKRSAELARPFLLDLGFGKERVDKICDIIEHHGICSAKKSRYRESKILCDADKLTQLGAKGFMRIIKNRLLYRKETLLEAVKKAEEKNKELYKTLFTKTAKDYIKDECDYIRRLCRDFQK